MFNPTQVHVESVVDKVAMGQVFLSVVHIPPDIVIPPVFRTHSFVYQRCNIIFPIDIVVREQTSTEKETSQGAMFLRALHGLLTALDLSAPCYGSCAYVLNI
jgi:hypothetical protein